jgi:hypothetical protein
MTSVARVTRSDLRRTLGRATSAALVATFGTFAMHAAAQTVPTPPAAPANGSATRPANGNGSTTAPATAPANGRGGVTDTGAGLLLNFQDVTIDTILNELSASAGFIVVKEVKPEGRVTLVSRQPVSREESVA